MARSRLTAGLMATVAVLSATTAFAQFGNIFRDEPPRPPSDVPSAPPSQMPPSPSNRPPPTLRNGSIRPPADVRNDLPPDQPLPAPMALPPSSRPGAGGIEQVPLSPLPGTAVAPLPPPQEPPAANPPAQALPGLPPGQRQPRGAPSDAALQPGDEVVVAPPPQRIANPTAQFSGLDKITGRIISFDVAINETVQFGALQVTPRICYSRPPTETPNTDAFIDVDEVTLQGEIKRIFTGWMFAASPGLHAIEHPVYDVWLTDCKGGQGPAVAEAPPETAPPKPAPKQPPKPSAARTPPQPGFLPALR